MSVTPISAAELNTRTSAHAEIARHASRWTNAAQMQNSTFSQISVEFANHRTLWSGSASACRQPGHRSIYFHMSTLRKKM